MFKIIGIPLSTVAIALISIHCYAISPGAGQAQVRNNMQEMQQTQKNMQKNQQRMQQKKMQRVPNGQQQPRY